MNIRNKDGKFIRQRIIWTEENWDDGYIAKGRFRVYRPDYPIPYFGEGYVPRFLVVWWLHTGNVPQKGFDIHHKDGNKLNDRFDNLDILSHSEHSKIHNPQNKFFTLLLTCPNCNKEFNPSKRQVERLRDEKIYPKYCSIGCYHQYRKEHKNGYSRV